MNYNKISEKIDKKNYKEIFYLNLKKNRFWNFLMKNKKRRRTANNKDFESAAGSSFHPE